MFASTPVATSGSKWTIEHQRIISSLKNNHELVISRPDKGADVVLMDYTDCVAKMSLILNDTSKFVQLGPIEKCDTTTSIETKFQKQLLSWVKSEVLSPEI